jgi:hypothetical protein
MDNDKNCVILIYYRHKPTDLIHCRVYEDSPLDQRQMHPVLIKRFYEIHCNIVLSPALKIFQVPSRLLVF